MDCWEPVLGRISKRNATVNYSNRTVISHSSIVLPLHRFVGQLQRCFTIYLLYFGISKYFVCISPD